MLIIYPLLFAVTNNFTTFKYGDIFLCLFLSARGDQSFMYEIGGGGELPYEEYMGVCHEL